MRDRKVQNNAYHFFRLAMILWLLFAYRLLLAMIPDQIFIEDGDLRGLNFHMPITFSAEESGEQIIDTSSYTKGMHAAEAEVNSPTIQLTAKLFGMIPIKQVEAELVEEQSLYVSGEVVGLYVKTDGVMVIGVGGFKGKDNTAYEPARNVLKSGDYICNVDGEPVDTKEALIEAVNRKAGGHVVLSVRRNDEIIDLYIQPKQAEDGSYKLGVWVRDDLSGIGTLTYIRGDGGYGALGHAITDIDTGMDIEIEKGKLYNSKVVGIVKGKAGSPGELSGVINYADRYYMGDIFVNTQKGIFGRLKDNNSLPEYCKSYPVGYKQDVEVAPASIICDVDGVIREFAIDIVEVNYHADKAHNSILVEVKDRELLELTGGIVQGMSGSPIIQNGRIVGAVTHVFVQDSTRGYGIFIENMLLKEGES